MIDYAKQLKKDQGDLNREDYKQINDHFMYGEEPNKYVNKIRDLIEQYL